MNDALVRPLPAGSEDPVRFASAQQSHGSDPRHTAWVDASAGSGKTRTLVSRVLRLLLTGCDPHKLLCLTYTKAAAANMALRLNETLSHWATTPEKKLTQQLYELTGQAPDDETITLARQLFARMLEAPGGMQFQTIHSFCQSLLGRFPLEAGVPVGFTVLDERAAQHLLEQARQDVLLEASTNPSGLIDLAIDRLLRDFGTDGFEKLERTIISHRARLEPQLEQGAGPAILRLRALLELPEDSTEDSLKQAFCIPTVAVDENLRALLPHLQVSTSKTMPVKGEALARWLAADATGRLPLLEEFISLWLTQKGEALKNPFTADVLKACNFAGELASRQVIACQQYLAARASIRTFETSAMLITYAAALLGRYQQLKTQRLALDFDDLIEKATQLVTRAGMAPWVLYKLDGGIEHILVDEAQDTNPQQWQLLQAIAGEFFTGESRHPNQPPRTVFAVGDYKQSIFSFQGAQPAAFAAAKQRVQQLTQQAKQKFADTQFTVSFRSTPAVLAAVDAVFANAPAHDGLPEYQRSFQHISRFDGLPGRVELWPPAPGNGKTNPSWRLPNSRTELSAPSHKLAEAIAVQIQHWVDSGTPLPARGRAMRYGDILVLVRSRGVFAPDLIRSLKQRRIPVAGADRMVVREQLAVEDLLAFAEFLLLPEDDLTLACVLKGPLIGIDENTLFTLAHDRGGSLLQRLGQYEPTRDYAAWLAGWLKEADRITPYTLLARLLAQPCPAHTGSGRQAMLQRLGLEAADALDELLSLALAFEQQETPTLQGFVRWMQADASDVKRELEQAGGQVRIMTVHGAKGLEAPVVILADRYAAPTDKETLLLNPDGDEPPLLAPGRDNESPVARARRAELWQAQCEEYHRLLYVALTRAEDWLIIASWLNNNQEKPPETEPANPGWVELVRRGLQTIGHVQPMTIKADGLDWEGDALVYEQALKPGTKLREEKEAAAQATREAIAIPDWTLHPPAPEPTPARPLTPSKPGEEDEDVAASPLEEAQEWRWQRGLLMHRLLQTLPDLPSAQRRGAGLRLLAQLPSSAAQQMLEEVLLVIEGSDFAHLFGPGSRAEVPVTGLVNGKVIAGQIDRLLVTKDAVYIVDFKTNRPPARKLEEVPPAYLRQLAAYRDVLQRIYPSHRIETILLWTNIPLLMPIPASCLDAACP